MKIPKIPRRHGHLLHSNPSEKHHDTWSSGTTASLATTPPPRNATSIQPKRHIHRYRSLFAGNLRRAYHSWTPIDSSMPTDGCGSILSCVCFSHTIVLSTHRSTSSKYSVRADSSSTREIQTSSVVTNYATGESETPLFLCVCVCVVFCVLFSIDGRMRCWSLCGHSLCGHLLHLRSQKNMFPEPPGGGRWSLSGLKTNGMRHQQQQQQQ